MADNPIDPIRKLAERLQEQTEALGLTMRTFAVLPSFEGGPDAVQVIWTIDPDDLGRDLEAHAEQQDFDARFEQLTKEFKSREKDEKFDTARDELLRRLQQGGSIVPKKPEAEGET